MRELFTLRKDISSKFFLHSILNFSIYLLITVLIIFFKR